MLKEGQSSIASSLGAAAAASTNILDSSKKLNEAEICRICSILTTSEYCLDTTQQVIQFL